MFPINYGKIFGVPDDFNPPNDAELPGDVMHPNLNSLDYSKRPLNRLLRMHQIWEAIALSPSNQLIIGTNKASGRRWETIFWSFEDPAQPLKQSNSCFHLRCESLVSQITYLDDHVLLIAFRCGAVQLWSTRSRLCADKSPYNLFKIGEGPRYKKPVLSLDQFKTNTAKAASGDQAGTLVLWSAAGSNLVSTNTYAFAHTDPLSGLDTSFINENIIVTCGYDKRALLWDCREQKPAIALFENHKVRFNDIAWHAAPGDQENLLAIGDETGFVHTLDTRKAGSFVQSTQLLNRPIRKILPRNEKIGIIGDSTTVLVASSSNHEVLYRNEDALDCQRDGVWRLDTELYTVGHDGKLHAHQISEK